MPEVTCERGGDVLQGCVPGAAVPLTSAASPRANRERTCARARGRGSRGAAEVWSSWGPGKSGTCEREHAHEADSRARAVRLGYVGVDLEMMHIEQV